MKHLKRINENQGEYLMVVHFESGDEIHLTILEMSHYQPISDLIGSGHPGDVQGSQLSDYIYQNKVDDLMCQTYVLEDYLFNKYNIVKVIHIPDVGN